jgi:hypothetical protein
MKIKEISCQLWASIKVFRQRLFILRLWAFLTLSNETFPSITSFSLFFLILLLQLEIKISSSWLNLYTRSNINLLSKFYQSSKFRLWIFDIKFTVFKSYFSMSPRNRNIRNSYFTLMPSA